MLFPNGKKFRQPVIITRTKVPNTDQVNFPVLFSITARDLAHVSYGGGVENVNGWDIIFASDPLGLNKLDHEIESYDKTTGTFIAWVRLPKVYTSIDTLFYIFYGGKVIASQENITGVWDSNFKGVYHLKDGTSLNVNDSTSNALNMTATSLTATSGKVDGAADFDGTSGRMYAAATAVTTLTYSAWIKADALPGAGTENGAAILGMYSRIDDDAPEFSATLGLRPDGKLVGYTYDGSIQSLNGATTLSTNTWYHVAYRQDTGVAMKLYLNGVEDGSQAIATPYTSWSNGPYYVSSYLSKDYNGSTDFRSRFNGQIDELRISNIARSANWITTEYNNQNSPSTFLSLDKRWTMRKGIVVPKFFGATSGTAYTKTLTDSSTISDVLIKAISKTLSEAQSYADTLIKAISKTLSENQSYADTLTKLKVVLKTLTETVTNTDTLVRAMSKTLSEAQSIADSIIKGITKTFTENQSYIDTLAKIKVTLKTLTESFTSTDTLTKSVNKIFAEAQTITDSVIKGIYKTFTETHSLSDLLTYIHTTAGAGINNIKNYILKLLFKTNYPVKNTKKNYTIKLGK